MGQEQKLSTKNSAENPQGFPFSLLASGVGVLAVGIGALVQETYWSSLVLCLIGLGAFITSFFLTLGTGRQLLERVARWIDLSAFVVVIINLGTFLAVGGGANQAEADQTVPQAGAQECVSRLKLGHGGWNDTYREGSRYIPVAPTYYFYMRGRVTPSDTGLRATGYVFGKAWYVFWTRWGDVDLDLTTTISCEGACEKGVNKCLADFSTTGNSSRQESIVRGVLEEAATRSGNEVRMVIAISGSLSASGGPSVEAGKDPLKVTIAWPDATAENTFQAGTYKWRCECE